MKNRAFRIKLLTLLGLLVGAFNIFIVAEDKSNMLFLFIGTGCIILSLGLFFYKNWARIIAIIFSILFIFIYLLLLIYTFLGAFQGFGGIGLLFNFPVLLFSLFVLNALNRPNIKEQFLSQQKKRP
ncbi:MAG: hypothetical protein NTX01_04220 [Candidatus Omnitrophica bacterium]|nr:hypothetical protein [Candidatus Omnitrophota bacterium]